MGSVVFAENRKGKFDLFIKDSDGSKEETLIPQEDSGDRFPSDWSHDGKHILYEYHSDSLVREPA